VVVSGRRDSLRQGDRARHTPRQAMGGNVTARQDVVLRGLRFGLRVGSVPATIVYGSSEPLSGW
jgi:hypothetical protein